MLDFRNNIWWHCRSFGSLCNSLHSHVTLFPLGPRILLSTLFSNTLSLRFARFVSDQVSHPYKTTGRIIDLCILSFAFWIANRKTKNSEKEWQQAFYDFSDLDFFKIEILEYLNCIIFSKTLVLTFHIAILSCIPVTKHDRSLIFLSIYF
jgi:hypothetical protein